MVLVVQGGREDELPEIALAHGGSASVTSTSQDRQQHAREEGNDCDDDEQLDECETAATERLARSR